MADLKLSDDGLYYWDGQKWVSTLSPDGHFRWNGSAWVPVAGMSVPSYPQYRQPVSVRVPTPWTRPLQYAVVAYYALSLIYALSLPFWMSGTMSQIMNQSFQRQAAQNPLVSPPPPELVSTITTMMTGVLWVGALIGAAIAAVAVIGALKRWTWIFYVILVFLGLGAISLPLNFAGAIGGSSPLNPYQLPAGISWLSVAIGIPGAALFVWMLVALIRYGPWATTNKVELAGAAQAPAS